MLILFLLKILMFIMDIFALIEVVKDNAISYYLS